MRKHLIVILAIVALVMTSGVALSADQMLEAKIQSATESIDKNGNPYVRFIIEEQRTMQGVTYSVGVPVMAFGPTVEQAQTLKAGDTLKAIVKKREWQSRESYTILAFL